MPVSPRARQIAAAQHPSAPPTWRGWWRPIGTGEQCWRVLCEADDYSACWKQLLDRLPAISGEAVVLRGERVP